VSVEKPAAGGRIIARHDGQVVLVQGAIPGERVRARIERVGKGVAYATTVAVEDASPDRRAPFTDPMCGGCLFAHVAYSRQLTMKAQIVVDACARIGRFTAPLDASIVSSPDEGYRMRARLHLRGARAGFYREGTHALCDARATRQLLGPTCDAVDAITDQLRASGVGSVQELEISENVDGSGRAIHLSLWEAGDRRRVKSITAPPGVTGLTVGEPLQTTSVSIISGSPFVTDAITCERQSIALRRHVLAFFQGNRFLLNNLVSRVLSAIAADSTVIDLYAGVGLFAVSAAMVRGARVTAVEADRVAAADLTVNVREREVSVEVVHQPVERFTSRSHPKPEVLVIDPPRTGMSKDALAGALTLDAKRVVYVSCDPATFARDARQLIDAGYTIDQMQVFDLFPNTPHVETVAVFEKG
jgi:23S rRNA (uracil1939-C5)-methyltransferase